MILIDGVMLAGGITKNEAPEMFENVLVFAGQNSPADGQFRDLSFSSNEGEQNSEVISWLMLIVGSIGRRRQKYFSIRGKKGEVLSGWEGTSVFASPPANVSCRWPLASLSKQFHWRENFLVNGLGHFLGVETTSLCGPGFEVMKATVGGGTR